MFVYKRKMMDIMHAITKWKHYLWERHFKICTYHVSLKYLLHQKVATLAHHLWLVKLLGYDYEIKCRKEKENVASDSLSRIFSSDLYALVVFYNFHWHYGRNQKVMGEGIFCTCHHSRFTCIIKRTPSLYLG